MSRQVILEDGTEIDLPDNILDELKSEAVQEFRDENPDVDKIDEFKLAAEEAQTKLQEIEEKQKNDTTGKNMSELRKQKESAEKEAKEAQDKLGKEIAEVKNLVVNKTKSETLKHLIGDDEEMNKKVQHIYDTQLSGMPSTTDVEIADRVKAAYRLAQPDKTPSSMGYDVVSSGSGTGNIKREESEVDLDFAKKLGLDADKIKNLKPKVKEMRERRTI